MVPALGMSWRITTLLRVKYAVGPYGMCDTTSASDGRWSGVMIWIEHCYEEFMELPAHGTRHRK